MTEKTKGGTIELWVQDYKGVRELHTTLVMGLNAIGGPNGAGKSSGVDAVANIFGGKELTPEKPIRAGADGFRLEAMIAELGLKIVREGVLREDGQIDERLIVTEAEGLGAGTPLRRPQEILDKLMGNKSVVLQSVSSLPTAKQIELLKRITGLDFSRLDADRGLAYEQRRRVKIRKADKDSRIDAMEVYSDVPGELVSVSDLLAALTERREYNDMIDLEESTLAELKHDRSDLVADAQLLEKRVAALRAELASTESEWGRARVAISDANAEIERKSAELEEMHRQDEEEIEQQISGAEEINTKVRSNSQRVALVGERDELTTQIDSLAKRIMAIDNEKAAQLASAAFPVPGMTFDAEGVYLKGIPLEQCSHVEQINVDVAIALALKPEVPIILIHDGSLYDAKARAALDKLARKNGVYVVFERVMDSIAEAYDAGAVVYMQDGIGLDPREIKGGSR